MHPSLKPYENRVYAGHIRHQYNGDLVLYNYTKYPTIIFPFILKQNAIVDKLIMKIIRLDGNKL